MTIKGVQSIEEKVMRWQENAHYWGPNLARRTRRVHDV
jgi:hypothetical protein